LKAKARTSPKRKRTKAASPQAIDRLIATGGTVISENLKHVRFAGVALGGGKTDKTVVAVIEYYPAQKRVFLRSLRDRISGKGEIPGDEALLDILNKQEPNLNTIAFDVPLTLPKCLACELRCPGVEKCRVPVIRWMREMHKKRERSKRPNKMFTPYTERAAEIFISNELEEPFHPSHALGSNAAPLTARAYFLKRRIKTPLIEFFPKLTLWRIGCALGIQKSYLRFHRHSVDGDEARLYILKTLIDRGIAFIYHQDMRLMVENNAAFEAFLGALTAFLKYRGQTEKRPTGYPKDEAWIEYPKQDIQWF